MLVIKNTSLIVQAAHKAQAILALHSVMDVKMAFSSIINVCPNVHQDIMVLKISMKED